MTPPAHAQAPMGQFREDCRLCRSRNLDIFLDFGMHPHSDGFVREEALREPEPYFPLAVALCVDCGQIQLTYTVSPAYLYGTDDYLYDSTITATGRSHFLGMASDIVDEFGIAPDSLAVDIGSNVGLLLSGFQQKGMRVRGIDPAPRMTAIAVQNGIDTLTECFSAEVAGRVQHENGRASAITATNVFAHIDDLDDVMAGIDALLDDKGVFVIEAPYTADLVEKFEYDTIYHQHLSYLSVAPMVRFMERFGMEIFDVRRTSIHGGSMRYFVSRKGGRDVRPSVQEFAALEKQSGLHTVERMHEFAKQVANHRAALIKMLVGLKDKGHTLAAIGAPAKGSTLLNYCGINSSLLEFATEKNKLKVGRYTPGTHIPILPDEALFERKPDYAVILPWNFATEIKKNLARYQEEGGTFIVPIPVPTIG